MSENRISRTRRIALGFHRIGLVLGGTVALVGIAFSLLTFSQGWQGGSFVMVGLAIAALALPLYAICWAVGWVARGFAGENT